MHCALPGGRHNHTLAEALPRAIVPLPLPEVQTRPEGRPCACRDWGSELLQGWEGSRKPVRHPPRRPLRAQRLRRDPGGRSFRHSPQEMSAACSVFGVKLGPRTVGRDVQAWAQKHRRRCPVGTLGLRHWPLKTAERGRGAPGIVCVT